MQKENERYSYHVVPMQICDYLKITFGELEELLNEIRQKKVA